MSSNSAGLRPLHLYLHIPYCKARCDFCSQRVCLDGEPGMRSYCDALVREMESSAADFADYVVTSVVIGGGCPTSLPQEVFEKLVRRMRTLFCVAEDAQITVELPHNGINASWMVLFQRLKVNRLSVFLATGRDAECVLLGLPSRIASAETTLILPQMMHLPDYEAILLTGIPGQTVSGFGVSLRFAVRYHSPEITILPMQPPTGSAWQKKKDSLPPYPSGEEIAAMLDYARQHLSEKGYEEYRPGRWARDGFCNQDLLARETEEDYLSFGAGTTSCTEGIIYRTTDDLAAYLAAPDDPAAIYTVTGRRMV